MSKLTDFKLLCFDVYGTLIDWETGIIAALQPLIAANNASPSKHELMKPSTRPRPSSRQRPRR